MYPYICLGHLILEKPFEPFQLEACVRFVRAQNPEVKDKFVQNRIISAVFPAVQVNAFHPEGGL